MRSSLGPAIEQDGELVWSATGRPLSGWEVRMRDRCGRLWLPMFDAAYLLILRMDAQTRFGERHGTPPTAFTGFHLPRQDWDSRVAGVPLGNFIGCLQPKPPTHAQCLEIISDAVAGGGRAVINGSVQRVSAGDAAGLTTYFLGAAPTATLFPIVGAILDHAVFGAEPTEAERAAFTIGTVEPVPPVWALLPA